MLIVINAFTQCDGYLMPLKHTNFPSILSRLEEDFVTSKVFMSTNILEVTGNSINFVFLC